MNFNNIINHNLLAGLELAEILLNENHTIRPRFDAFALSDRAFIKKFRLDKATFEELYDAIEGFLVAPTRASAVPKHIKILSTLNFLATGSYQNDIGNSFTIGLSTYSVSKALHEVIDAVNRPEVFNRFVQFPRNLDGLNQIRTRFFAKYGMPGVVGCIDCTHIAIHPPPIEHPIYPEHVYVNRKGYHSINVQLICDINTSILNINARFPGSTHDRFVYNNSMVPNYFGTLHQRNFKGYHLLGDSGYVVRPWMMTPYHEPEEDTPQFRFNQAHKSARSTIERCNGILKSRFRCLCKERALHYDPITSSKIINTCAVLHNLCIKNNVPLEEEPIAPEGNLNNLDELLADLRLVGRVNPLLAEGMAKRDSITRQYFN